MSFSALYMHELHRKYYHGDYVNLESLHEESNRTDNEDDDDDNDNIQRSTALNDADDQRNINQIV